MRAALISSPRKIEITNIPDPTPTPNEVVLEIASVGICGTDIHIFDGGYPAKIPIVPGHEFCGTVIARGAEVRGLNIGDRVAADPNIPCMRCRYCHLGRFNLCDNYEAIGVTLNGAAAQYVSVPEHLCVLLPDTIDLADATLIEPLSCALHAFDLLGSKLGSSVAIYGSGTIGLMMLQLAKRTGVSSVDLIDVNPLKLVAARELGASRTSTNSAELDVGRGWDVVIDATGVVAAIEDGISHVAKGGTFLQFGVSSPDAVVAIHPFRIYDHEITIIGSVCPLNSFERAVELMSIGAIDPRTLISHRLPLDSYSDALSLFASGATRKIVIAP